MSVYDISLVKLVVLMYSIFYLCYKKQSDTLWHRRCCNVTRQVDSSCFKTGLACSEVTLGATSDVATTHTAWGLPASTDIAGKYVTSVGAQITTAQTSTIDGVVSVAILYNTAIPQVSGETLTYTGTCDAGGAGFIWTNAGLSTKYLPKI